VPFPLSNRRLRQRALAALLGLALLALAPAAARADVQPLRWSPPPLVNPTTIQLGQGVTHTVLDPSKDYIIKLPSYQKVGGTEIEGGHNVVIKGGSIAIPPTAANDPERRGIYIKNNEGTVHIEGVQIEDQPGAIGDGIDISAPDSTVQVENVRIVNINGGLSTFHADVIQPWGGVKDLRVDGLTGTSNYQGLFLAQDLGPIGSVELQRINLSPTPGPYDGGGHMLWITSGVSSCASYPLSLSNVYIQPRVGRSLGTSVWPQLGSSLACTGSTAGGEMSWSALGVNGGVSEGTPLSGDFVPDRVAGLSYASPGYGSGAVAPPESPLAPTAGTPVGGASAPAAAPPPNAALSGSTAGCAGCTLPRAATASPAPHKASKTPRRKAHHKKHHKRHRHKKKRRRTGHNRKHR
jgi:hypothetical protein